MNDLIKQFFCSVYTLQIVIGELLRLPDSAEKYFICFKLIHLLTFHFFLGVRYLTFSNIYFEPGNKFTVDVGSMISISGLHDL